MIRNSIKILAVALAAVSVAPTVALAQGCYYSGTTTFYDPNPNHNVPATCVANFYDQGTGYWCRIAIGNRGSLFAISDPNGAVQRCFNAANQTYGEPFFATYYDTCPC